MKCPKCGFPVLPKHAFCPKCGNPLTDEALPESDIVNQVRISRCLFFVSDILRQVIEKGGLKKAPKEAKVPFELSAEQLSRFQLFEQPIFISAITERINSLIENENMRSFLQA